MSRGKNPRGGDSPDASSITTRETIRLAGLQGALFGLFLGVLEPYLVLYFTFLQPHLATRTSVLHLITISVVTNVVVCAVLTIAAGLAGHGWRLIRKKNTTRAFIVSVCWAVSIVLFLHFAVSGYLNPKFQFAPRGTWLNLAIKGLLPLAAVGLGLVLRPWLAIRRKCHLLLPSIVAAGGLVLSMGLAPLMFGVVEEPFRGQTWRRVNSSLARAPNIIVILVDTLRADHLSAHGRNQPTSPNLDRIAGEGVLFENAFAHSNWTPPSTVTLLTSLYESVHGVNQVKGFVPNKITSVAEVLGQAGYTSAFWSANTVVGARNNYTQGFDYTDQISEAYQAIKGRNQLPPYQLYAWRTIASRFPPILPALGGLNDFFESLFNEVGVDMGNPVEVDEGRLVNSVKTWAGHFRARKADWMFERVRAYLSYMTTRPGYDPRRNKFFLYLHYFDPHTPYRPPGAYKRRFDPGFKGRLAPLKPGGKKVCRQAGSGSGAGGCSVEWFPGKRDPPLRARELQNMVAQYDGEILFLDRFIGKLVGRLKETGLFENTLLIITSDHGEAFWEHKQYGHGQTVYQEEVHIPLIVSWPRRLRGGRRVRDLVGLVDIMPTLLEAAGIPPVPCMQGRSFWKVMSGKERRREVYGETTDYDHAKLFLVRDHLKLIYELEGVLIPARSYRVRKRLLFDLRDDPGERKNLLGLKGAPTPPAREVESLQASLDRWYKTVRRPCRFYQPSEADTSKDIEDRLKALGYID